MNRRRLRNLEKLNLNDFPDKFNYNYIFNEEATEDTLEVYYTHDHYKIIREIILNNNITKPLEIPFEINKLIAQYITNSNIIDIKFKIKYPISYPFDPPKWKLYSYNSLICSKNQEFEKHHIGKIFIDLKNYLHYKICNHNNRYNIDWSPALLIEKDIQIFLASLDLNFILKNIVYDIKFLNLLKHTQKQYGFGW